MEAQDIIRSGLLLNIAAHSGLKFSIQVARVVLTANSTFAHLMNKAGLFDDLSHSVKPAGDALETIFAALHSERGADAFQAYARQYFLPLIETVGLDYDAFRYACHHLTSPVTGR